MSSGLLSTEAQLRYMLQWFGEWSELQRADFLPILAEKVAAGGVYVNGIVHAMSSTNCQDKPMNLFQCRVKLFHDWFTSWSNEQRDRLIEKVSEMDEGFGKKLQEEITGNRQVIEDVGAAGEGLVTAQPGVVAENGDPELPEGEEEEVENQEVIAEPQMLQENNIPIEITAE